MNENISREIIPDGTFFPEMPLDRIVTWEHNPRKEFAEEALAELIASIVADGVQQPIVVRAVTRSFGSLPEGGAAQAVRYQIVMGERRYRASLLAGKKTIPAIVRTDMDDDKALELALVENLQRRDLNAIEEAKGYAAMQELGHRQSAIAEKLHRSQGEIANKLRLLKLPDDVQQLIVEGKLTATHARAILRFESFPAVMSKIAELAVENGATAKELESDVPYHHDLGKAKLALTMYGYEASFDIEKVCKKSCPFKAYFKSGYGGHVCLKPEHYQELEKVAVAEKKARIETARQELLQRQEAAKSTPAPSTAAPPSPAAASETMSPETTIPEAPPVTAPTGLYLRDLKWDEYENLSHGIPSGCSDACPCRTQALDGYDKLVPICLDKKRLQTLKAQQTRVEQKARKSIFAEIEAEINKSLPTDADARAIAILLWNSIFGMAAELRRAISSRFEEPIKGMLEKGYWSGYDAKPEHYDALATLGIKGIQNLALELKLAAERKQALDNRSSYLELHGLWLRRSTRFDSLEEAETEIQGADPANDEQSLDHEYCVRCNAHIPKDALGAPVVDESIFHEGEAGELRLLKLETGVLVREDDDWSVYCAECAPKVLICRGCGCTDEFACDEGCYWIEEDLCSVCSEQLEEDLGEKGWGEPAAAASEAIEMPPSLWKEAREAAAAAAPVQFQPGDKVWVKNRFDDQERPAIVEQHLRTSIFVQYEDTASSEWRFAEFVRLRTAEEPETPVVRMCASCGTSEVTVGRYCAMCDPAAPTPLLETREAALL